MILEHMKQWKKEQNKYVRGIVNLNLEEWTDRRWPKKLCDERVRSL